MNDLDKCRNQLYYIYLFLISHNTITVPNIAKKSDITVINDLSTENIYSGLLFGKSLFDVLHAYKLRENARTEEDTVGIKMMIDYS